MRLNKAAAASGAEASFQGRRASPAAESGHESRDGGGLAAFLSGEE